MRHTYRPPVKPPPGHLTLNRAHPLAQNLIIGWVLNEGAGARAHNVAIPHDYGTITGLPWHTGVGGVGLQNEGDSSSDFVVNQKVINADQCSIAIRFSLDTLPGAQRIFLGGFVEGGTFEKDLATAEDNKLRWYVQNVADDPESLEAGRIYTALGVQDHLANAITLYKDGKAVASNTSMSFLGYTVPAIRLGGEASFMATWPFRAYHMYVWNRALTPTEAWELHKDPYGFLMPVPAPATYFFFQQGGGGGGAAHTGKIWSPAQISHPALLT